MSLGQTLRPVFLLVLLALGWPLRAPATVIVPPDFDALAAGSDYVIRARVTETTAELVPSATGRKIVTRVKVDVLEVIAGEPPADLVLVCLGGRVGDEELIVDGAPVFNVGDESILFVKGNGRAFSPLFAMTYGQYLIRTDADTKRRYVARGNDVPLESVDEVAQPLLDAPAAAAVKASRNLAQALSPDEFALEIKTARRRQGIHVDDTK
ncbi:MAG: hypothetical protein RIS54_1067 [Verrucomicrobiota bacterium]|jgi:hypothetical protein